MAKKDTKASRGRGADAPGRQRLNVWLSSEAYVRLNVHALMRGHRSLGALVEELVTANLRDYRVQANPASVNDRPTGAVESTSASCQVA